MAPKVRKTTGPSGSRARGERNGSTRVLEGKIRGAGSQSVSVATQYITERMVAEHPERRGVVPNMRLLGSIIPEEYLDEFVRSRVNTLRPAIRRMGGDARGRSTKSALFALFIRLRDQRQAARGGQAGRDAQARVDRSMADEERVLGASRIRQPARGTKTKTRGRRQRVESPPPPTESPEPNSPSAASTTSASDDMLMPASEVVASPLPNAFYLSEEILETDLKDLISDRAHHHIRPFLERVRNFNPGEGGYGDWAFKNVITWHNPERNELARMVEAGQRTFGRGFDIRRGREESWNRVLGGGGNSHHAQSDDGDDDTMAAAADDDGDDWRTDNWMEVLQTTPYILSAWTRDIRSGIQPYPRSPESYHGPNLTTVRQVLRDNPEMGDLFRRLITNGDILLPPGDTLEDTWDYEDDDQTQPPHPGLRPLHFYIPGEVLMQYLTEVIDDPYHIGVRNILTKMLNMNERQYGVATLADVLQFHPEVREKLAIQRFERQDTFEAVGEPPERWNRRLEEGWASQNWDVLLDETPNILTVWSREIDNRDSAITYDQNPYGYTHPGFGTTPAPAIMVLQRNPELSNLLVNMIRDGELVLPDSQVSSFQQELNREGSPAFNWAWAA